MLRSSLLALCALAAACTASTPGADSARAAADSGVPAPAPPAVVDSPAPAPAPAAPPTAVDSPPKQAPVPGPRPSRPSRATPRDSTPRDSTPGRPRMTPRPPHPVPRPMPPGAGGDVDQATIDRLRAEAKALVHVDGCASSGDCAVLPLGERACGGPEEYVVYCPKTTDVAALRRKATELARAQKDYNARHGVMSTCEMRMPPKAVLVGGSCRAASVGVPDAPAVRVP